MEGVFRISIRANWCKSCGICSTFCPAGALALQPGDQVRIVDASNCTGCGLCERLCPDLAIEISRIKAQA